MANPNIVNVQGINGNTSAIIPASAYTPTVLLANAAGSANVYKVGLVSISNLSTSAQTATVAYYTNGAVSANSTASGGVSFPIANSVSIPANASLVVTDKVTNFYITENTSIVVTSAYANQLAFIAAYEQIY